MADGPKKPLTLRIKLPYAGEDEFLERFGGNLARGGVTIASPNPRPLGTRVLVEFVGSTGSILMSAEGEVVRAQAPGVEGRGGMTIRFTRLDGRSRALLDRAVAMREGTAVAEAPARPPREQQVTDVAARERLRRRMSILEGMNARPGEVQHRPEPVLGIDLGTTNCRAAVHVEGVVRMIPVEGRNTALPSVVAFDERGRMLLGTRARAQLLVEPRSAIFGAKRLIGRRARSAKVREIASHFPYEICADEAGDAAVRIGDRIHRIPELASHLLAEIRNRASEHLGRRVRLAVICVPAWFTDRQRQAVIEAAQLADLEVVQVISEPTAVAIAFGVGRALARKRLLVYDLGGGTFDASVLEATGDDFEVIATGGDNFLGGFDFDLRVATELERNFASSGAGTLADDALTRQRIRDAAESAKIALSEVEETRVHVPWVASNEAGPVDLDVPFTRARLEALTRDLVERACARATAVLEARQISPAAINEVLLVGGQSRAPLVRRSVEALFGRTPSAELDPHDAVAIGAAMLGRAARDEDRGFLSIRLAEVLSSPIGIGMRDGRLHRVLDRNTRMPCRKSLSLPVGPGGLLRLALYQGDSPNAEENEFLGALTLQAEVRGELSIGFELSRDGVLALSARTPDGRAATVTMATEDAPDEVRAALLAEAPLPGDEAEDGGPGLLGGIRRLFGRG